MIIFHNSEYSSLPTLLIKQNKKKIEHAITCGSLMIYCSYIIIHLLRQLVGFRYEKKDFIKIVTSLVTALFKMTLYLCIYFVFTKKNIILSLFKIDTLNFTMYILTILTCPLKTYVIRLHNLISVNIFFTERSLFFFIIVKRQPKTNKLLK